MEQVLTKKRNVSLSTFSLIFEDYQLDFYLQFQSKRKELVETPPEPSISQPPPPSSKQQPIQDDSIIQAQTVNSTTNIVDYVKIEVNIPFFSVTISHISRFY